MLLLKTHAGAEDSETARFTSDAHLHLLSVTQVPTGAQTADILKHPETLRNHRETFQLQLQDQTRNSSLLLPSCENEPTICFFLFWFSKVATSSSLLHVDSFFVF